MDNRTVAPAAPAASILRLLAVASVVAAMLWAASPLGAPGFPAGHDMGAHLTYSYLFDRAAAQGQFPIRWVQLVQDGRSQPLFNFYQPGLYYLVQLVHLAIPSLSLSLKLTIVLLWWGGSAFMFLLCRPFGLLSGAMAALLFGLSPYVLLDVYVRAAYPELAALACAPAVLWSVSRFATTGRVAYLAVVALVTFLMLISHLPSVLICSPLIAAFTVRLASRQRPTLRRLLMLAGAGLVGAAMASFYVVPALGELRFVNIRALTTNYFDYRAHFVQPGQWVRYEWGYSGSVPGSDDGMSFQIAVVQWAAIAVAVAIVLAGAVRRRSGRAGDLIFWLSTIGLAMVLTTEMSAPVWELVTPLRFVQFPWRFLMLVAVAGGALAATLLSLVRSSTVRGVIVIGAAALQIWLSADYVGHPRRIAEGRMTIDYTAWAETPQARAIGFVEEGYYPAGVEWNQDQERPPGRWSVRRGEAEVRAVVLKDHVVVLDARTANGAQLAIHAHYFPGWAARLDGSEVEFDRAPGSRYLLVDVPPGNHRVEAEFTETALRRTADMISLAGLGAFVLLLGASVRSMASSAGGDGDRRASGSRRPEPGKGRELPTLR